jgi:hypothetical protein
MKAPSNPKIERLFRDPQVREQFRQQLKARTGISKSTGRQTISVHDAAGDCVVRLNVVPAKVPF